MACLVQVQVCNAEQEVLLSLNNVLFIMALVGFYSLVTLCSNKGSQNTIHLVKINCNKLHLNRKLLMTKYMWLNLILSMGFLNLAWFINICCNTADIQYCMWVYDLTVGFDLQCCSFSQSNNCGTKYVMMISAPETQ